MLNGEIWCTYQASVFLYNKTENLLNYLTSIYSTPLKEIKTKECALDAIRSP